MSDPAQDLIALDFLDAAVIIFAATNVNIHELNYKYSVNNLDGKFVILQPETLTT